MKNKLIKTGLICMTLGSVGAYAVPSLYLNFIESNKHVDSKVMNYYKVRGFAGDVIESKISNLSADADLYVKIGSEPTKSSKDCRSTNGSTTIDSCSLTLSEDADVYIGVFGYKAADYAVQATLKDTKVKTIDYNQDVFGITPRLKHRDYKIHANAGDVLKIRAYDMDADGDIYVNLGSKARRGVSYVDSSRQSGSVDEEVTIEIDNETDVYIGLYADKSCIHTVEHHIKVTRTNAVEEVTVLNSGEADSGFVALKKWKYFKIHASAGDTVKGILNGLDADADLYIKVGDKPTKSTFDCRSTIGQTAVDSCDVTVSENADVYIGVFGYKATDFTIMADVTHASNYALYGTYDVVGPEKLPNEENIYIYKPKKNGVLRTNAPVVIYAKGGFAEQGSDSLAGSEAFMKYVASKGYAVIGVRTALDAKGEFQNILKALDQLGNVANRSNIGLMGASTGGGRILYQLRRLKEATYAANSFIISLDGYVALSEKTSNVRLLDTTTLLLQFGGADGLDVKGADNGATSGIKERYQDPRILMALYNILPGNEKSLSYLDNHTHGYASGSMDGKEDLRRVVGAMLAYKFENAGQTAKNVVLNNNKYEEIDNNKLDKDKYKYGCDAYSYHYCDVMNPTQDF